MASDCPTCHWDKILVVSDYIRSKMCDDCLRALEESEDDA